MKASAILITGVVLVVALTAVIIAAAPYIALGIVVIGGAIYLSKEDPPQQGPPGPPTVP